MPQHGASTSAMANLAGTKTGCCEKCSDLVAYVTY